MGTKMDPSYACVFMGYLEETIFKSYRGPTPDLYKCFIDDIIGASSLHVMDCHATARCSNPGRNGVFIELHVLRKGQ